MFPIDRTLRPWALAIVVALGSLGGAASIAADPVRIRVEPLTVPPATQPLISVVVRNLQEDPCTGTLSISGPADWRIAPDSQPLELAAGGRETLGVQHRKGPQCRSQRVSVHDPGSCRRPARSLRTVRVRGQRTVFQGDRGWPAGRVAGRHSCVFRAARQTDYDQHFLASKAFLLAGRGPGAAARRLYGCRRTAGRRGPAGDLVAGTGRTPRASRTPDALSSCWRRRGASPSVFSWPPGTRRENGPVKHKAWSPWCAATPRRQSCGTAR